MGRQVGRWVWREGGKQQLMEITRYRGDLKHDRTAHHSTVRRNTPHTTNHHTTAHYIVAWQSTLHCTTQDQYEHNITEYSVRTCVLGGSCTICSPLTSFVPLVLLSMTSESSLRTIPMPLGSPEHTHTHTIDSHVSVVLCCVMLCL